MIGFEIVDGTPVGSSAGTAIQPLPIHPQLRHAEMRIGRRVAVPGKMLQRDQHRIRRIAIRAFHVGAHVLSHHCRIFPLERILIIGFLLTSASGA